MNLSFRSVLALAVLVSVLLFLSWKAYSWHVYYTEFRVDVTLGSVLVGLMILSALRSSGRPNRGLPVVVGRDRWESYYGRSPSPAPRDADQGSSKSQRTFGSAVGGHTARTLGNLKVLVGHGAGHERRVALVVANS